MDPLAASYDVNATREATYRARAESAYKSFGIGLANGSDARQAEVSVKAADASSEARKLIIDSLRGSPEIIAVGGLLPDGRFNGGVVPGAFSPIFFEYILPKKLQLKTDPSKDALAKKLYFVYNGRLMIVAAPCGPGRESPAITEAVIRVGLQLSKSGLGFRWLSPIPTFQPIELASVSIASSPISSAFNDSVRWSGTTTTIFERMPKNVQESLRSLFATSCQYLMRFYSLKEEFDTKEALIQTIDSHRKTVLDLMNEYNQTKGSQFFRRRRLRKLIRVHCLNLTEKIGRLEEFSDSLAQGIDSLDRDLQHEPDLKAVLETSPNWKSYLRNEFDSQAALDMVARINDGMSRDNVGSFIIWVTILGSIAGGLAGFILGRFV
jgi:hypothetical protein